MDRALERQAAMKAFIRQDMDQKTPFAESVSELKNVIEPSRQNQQLDNINPSQ